MKNRPVLALCLPGAKLRLHYNVGQKLRNYKNNLSLQFFAAEIGTIRSEFWAFQIRSVPGVIRRKEKKQRLIYKILVLVNRDEIDQIVMQA